MTDKKTDENVKDQVVPVAVENKQLTKEEQFEKMALEFLSGYLGGSYLTDSEKIMFAKTARYLGLNPFKREIYCVAYGKDDKRQFALITGYQVYLERAYRSGLLKGWNVEFTGEGQDLAATIKIQRKDWDEPFTHTVYLKECIQYTNKWNDKDKRYEKIINSNWANKPRMMLSKVAVGQGFRWCFPTETGDLPYLDEEIHFDNDNDKQEEKPTIKMPEKIDNQQVEKTDPVEVEVKTGLTEEEKAEVVKQETKGS